MVRPPTFNRSLRVALTCPGNCVFMRPPSCHCSHRCLTDMGLGQSSRSLVSNRVNQLRHSGLEYHRLHLFLSSTLNQTPYDWKYLSSITWVLYGRKVTVIRDFRSTDSLSFSCRNYNPRNDLFIWSWPLPTECPAFGAISSRYTRLELSWCCSDSHVTLLVRDVMPGRGHFLVFISLTMIPPLPVFVWP